MINNKDCVIIIGGSQSHVPFIEAAKNLGFNTIVFDRDKNCQGAKCSDTFYEISTHDVNQIVSKCYEINDLNNLKGVMTFSSFTEPLIAVAKICEKLNLPTFSSESVKLATNKLLMKAGFSNNGIPTPEWIETDDINYAINYVNNTNEKLIIKPSSGSQGSKGVFLIDQESDVHKYFDIAKGESNDSGVILEKYFIGREFSVDGIVAGRKPVILSVSEKFNLGPQFNFTMCGFSMGKIEYEDEELQQAISLIKEIAINALKTLNILNSFFSVDIILTDYGPKVLECGVLLDCKIDRFLKFAGIDVYKEYIKLICGECMNIEPQKYDNGFSLIFKYANQEGVFMGLEEFDAPSPSGTKIEWERMNGDKVFKPKSVSDAICWVMAQDENSKLAFNKAYKVIDDMSLDISS